MSKIIISGGRKLEGKIEISGAKNSALPLMVASLLTKDPLVLSNLPHLTDITTMANLLINLGVSFDVDTSTENIESSSGRVVKLTADNITSLTAPYDLVSKMRASILVLGPIVARFGKAKVSLPGGCIIGSRPVDIHLDALEKMGAKIWLDEGYVNADTEGKKLQGAEIVFRKPSVGATEQILMAASLAEGTTVIKNAAKEPEIIDLANCLNQMGAKIKNAGSSEIIIEGVNELKGTRYKILPDRIEAGTYAIAAIITGGEIELLKVNDDILDAISEYLIKAGAEITKTKDGIKVKSKGKINAVDVETASYPGFPTDMQAQFVSLMAVAGGKSKIIESVFENRFMHVSELMRMGADITTEGNSIIIEGVEELIGAEVNATDLRASVCLVLAGLVAKGKTVVNNLHHLDRGYEHIEEKLSKCGAQIYRVYF